MKFVMDHVWYFVAAYVAFVVIGYFGLKEPRE